MSIKLNNNSDYINSADYKTLENRLTDLKATLEDLTDKSVASRKLRYAEVDIEVEREAGRIQPDEMYVPQHIIDTNIRREQASYIQYITQSSRAVILENADDPTVDGSLLEKDLTKRLRYPGWQLPAYANIDGFQANGYSIIELVYDDSQPGDLATEMVQYGDFSFVADTRDIQAVEMTVRQYYYTKTQLVNLSNPEYIGPSGKKRNPEDVWSWDQVEKVIGKDSQATVSDPGDSTDTRDKSLYRIHKIMFRINGVVNVAWACIGTADDWLRVPRKLYLGDRSLQQVHPLVAKMRQMRGMPPPSVEAYETMYPYILFPYLISENNTISHLKGRVFLDQDVQEAVTSLMSSTCTKARRAAGFYFSKDTTDPNDDILLQKNVFFRSGALINAKVQAFDLESPDPAIFNAIQMLVAGNQNETSMTNFAAMNRKDSRKTAKEMTLSKEEQQSLTTVQVVLYAIALTQQYSSMYRIIRNRVAAGLIKVSPQLQQLYGLNWIVKPSGDVDVIEKQKMIQTMMQAWEVVQNTGANVVFLTDLLEKMFPENAAKYVQAIQQQQQQQSSQQQQQLQAILQQGKLMSEGIIHLSKHPEMFSDTGRIHAFPIIEYAAQQLEQMLKGQTKK